MSRRLLASWMRLVYRGQRAAGKSAAEARAIARAFINEPAPF